jgi:hypothetical protein
MSTVRRKSKDPDILGSFAALKRAAKRARELARQTNTPCYVMIKGKIVDLTERDLKRKLAKSKPKKK